jgi:predicted amidohydrolase YtcJ
MCIVCGPGSAHLLRAIAGLSTLRARPRLAASAVAPRVVPPLDPTAGQALTGPADVILRGAILTMDVDAPAAEAIAVRAGRIQAVGDAATVLAHRGRLTRIIDLDGRTLLPGFVNAHWHMPFTLLCDWIDARGDPAPAEALARAARDAAPGAWIVLCADAAATLGLESVAHPVVVTDADGAIRTANRRAAEDGPVPRHVAGLLPRFSATPDAIRPRLARLLRATAAAGVTCLRVCGLGTLTGAGDIDLLRAVTAEAAPLRLRGMLDAALLAEWEALHLAPGCGDDIFRLDTLSVWPEAGRLEALLCRVAAAGWRAVVHAADPDEALDAFAAARPPGDWRCGLECRAMPAPGDIARMRELGLSLGLMAPPDAPPALPVSLGEDSATGPSAPLRMIAAAAPLIGVARALAAVTIDAARRCGVAAILGSLERGKYADFVFLDGAPGAASTVRATWMEGRETFRA